MTVANKWKQIELGQLAEKIDYGHTASADFSKNGPKFLRITDIQHGYVDWNSVPSCKATEAEEEKYALGEGDIVFARTGATTGKSFLIDRVTAKSLFASYLIRVRPNKLVNPRFLAHFFDTPNYWAQIKSSSRGAGQPGVNSSSLRKLKVPLPPLTEQKQIADILDKADDIRRKRLKAVGITKQFLRSTFLDMFGDPVINPKGLQQVDIGDAVKFVSGGTPSKKNLAYWNGEFPWVSPKDMKLVEINDAMDHVTELAFEETTLKRIPIDSILIVIRGMILAHTAPISINRRSVAINQDMKALLPTDGFRAEFVLWALRSQQNYILSRVATAAHGTKRIEVDEIKALKIPAVPLPEQDAFLKACKHHQRLVENAKSSVGDASSLFNSLVQQAFKGEL